jgi:2-hydroxymuconate-semialdehyde hydrolase
MVGTNATALSDDQALTPDDWPSSHEQEYARRQVALADQYGVEFESRVFESDAAGQIHYLVTGDPDGEPVVLLHGVSTTAATWLPMASSLTDEYRLYIPDRPGRGLSAAPSYRGRDLRRFMVSYLVELFDHLGLDRPHVVGNSLGGQQAFLLALDHDRVDRLCLVGAPGGVSTEFDLLWRLMTVRGVSRLLYWLMGRGDPVENAKESARQMLVVDATAIPAAFYELMAASSSLLERQQSLRSLQLEQGSFGRMHSLFDLRDELVGIDRPTAFVWGTGDSFWPPEVGQPVAERMPDAEFHVLDSHGHMPWLEPDEKATAKVRAFFAG